jgi:ethanolamine ammonia-lyase large subunit
VIGIPATNNLVAVTTLIEILDAFIGGHGIPTQSCVLTHITTMLAAIERDAPVDLVFQSIAGTQAANAGFAVDLALLAEGRDAALSLRRGTVGQQVMYFETGQGSALSAKAHQGVDQQSAAVDRRSYLQRPDLGRRLAPLVAVLIGERPGLTAPDSLGIYVTRAPRAGLDALGRAGALGGWMRIAVQGQLARRLSWRMDCPG